jgi:1-acyl-sn-glycerol-3-phosphate acyltransferase
MDKYLALEKEEILQKILPGKLRGAICFVLIVLNTLFWMFPLFAFGILKFLIPIPSIRKFLNRGVTFVCQVWNIWNDKIFDATVPVRWDIRGVENLDKNSSYLVLSNHQTWVDILALEKIFLKKIPFLKFFIKKELMWIPVLGFSWWALDFPVMRRYSKETLEKKPHLKGKDMETTQKACEKFRTMPVSVMNFAEGTRFTPEKHQRQRSPFKHLLRPKAGGTAFVLNALGDQFKTILNVTIVYPNGVKNIWEYVCGEIDEIIVRVEQIPVTRDILGDYFNDETFQKRFQEWLNTLWQRKNDLIDHILKQRSAA